VRVVDAADVGNDGPADPAHITRILDSPERAPALKRTLEALLTDGRARDRLRESLEETLETSRGLIGRWGVVLTGSSTYAELFASHVEMIGRIHGLWYFLAYGTRRGSQFRAPGGSHAYDWFIDNLLSMSRIALRLEAETSAIALQVVPPDWWDDRTDELAAPAHAQRRQASTPGPNRGGDRKRDHAHALLWWCPYSYGCAKPKT
jgi:hypothetical protein